MLLYKFLKKNSLVENHHEGPFPCCCYCCLSDDLCPSRRRILLWWPSKYSL